MNQLFGVKPAELDVPTISLLESVTTVTLGTPNLARVVFTAPAMALVRSPTLRFAQPFRSCRTVSAYLRTSLLLASPVVGVGGPLGLGDAMVMSRTGLRSELGIELIVMSSTVTTFWESRLVFCSLGD